MQTSIRNYMKESREKEIESTLKSTIEDLANEGLLVDFGKIGTRTTYAMIYNTDYSVEIVGYTFVKDLKFYNESLGKLKALQQAIARKEMSK